MKKGHETVKIEWRGGVLVLTMNNPPVNQLSREFKVELFSAFKEAFNDKRVKAILLTGAGKNFVSGADLNQLAAKKKDEEESIRQSGLGFARFLNSIEDGPKPVIAGINGNCLGGGFEFAMACHYRVAAQAIKLGSPEVQLGVIPAWGGLQRLPRLVGLPTALEMMISGEPITAERGYIMTLIDELATPERLFETAFKAAERFASGEMDIKWRRTRNRNERLPSTVEKRLIVDSFRKSTTAKMKGYVAPFKVIEAIEKGLTFDIEKDIERDVEVCSKLWVSDISRNLVALFLNSRSTARLPRIEGVRPKGIKKVAVLGGGMMGSGIVHLLLANGFEAVLWDINDDAIEKGLTRIRKTFSYHIEKKKVSKADLERMIQNRLTLAVSLEDLQGVDMVIEAVLEDMAIKQDIWKKVEDICKPSTVFGTNTSALPVTGIASVLADPGRMIGLHFFNPAERMQLLEIVTGKETSDETLSTCVAFGHIIKKIPIVVNDGAGFYVTRQLLGLFGETTFLVGEGVSPLMIDKALLDFGLLMGPFARADMAGLDIGIQIKKNFERSLGDRWKMSPLEDLVYQTGCYGRKTGAGWFDYTGKKPILNAKVMKVVDQYLKENGTMPKSMSGQEIVDRIFARGINEAAYIIEDGICDRPEDMDVAMVYGTGFPRYRGGILRYADSWGIEKVYEQLVKLEKEKGVRFTPADLLKDMARSGKTFYGH